MVALGAENSKQGKTGCFPGMHIPVAGRWTRREHRVNREVNNKMTSDGDQRWKKRKQNGAAELMEAVGVPWDWKLKGSQRR